MTEAVWYTIDENLVTRDLHPVTLEEALDVVEKCVKGVRSSYESFEGFVAANMFGFYRSKDEFIEICVHSPSEISVKFELPRTQMPWIVRMCMGPFQHEETVRSLDALQERVREFFMIAPSELQEKLRHSS
jgi:hypothetical protein